eukprot:GFUD01037997.1.p1 GENE.GFUD01037997.1~~GFUD01037997.1.p1  ORF type:complete len:194 (-),score=11.45 GFUD01037997.1:331-912(-)
MKLIFLSLGVSVVFGDKDCARVYEHNNYEGDSYLVRGENNNLGNNGWYDRISSVKIFAGCRLRAYDHVNFKGQVMSNPDISLNNEWSSLGDMNDRFSSLKCDCGKVCAQVYEWIVYGGDSYMIQQGEHNSFTQDIGWNDRISSIRVRALCELYVYDHLNYQGNFSYTSASYQTNSERSIGLNDRISSWKCDCQ